MSIILKISKFVCLPILTEWVIADDILSLDSAFCNKQRDAYLQLINSKNDGVFDFGEKNMNNKLKWICRKNVNILQLTLKHPNLKGIWSTKPDEDISLIRMLTYKLGLRVPPHFIVPFAFYWESFHGTSKLTSLNLSQCYTLSDSILLDMTKRCTKLQHVDLSECSQITDKAVIFLTARNCDLQHINLSECHAVSDESFLSLSVNCKKLIHVNAYNCVKLTGVAVHSLAAHCPDLQHLNLGVSETYRRQYHNSTSAQNPVTSTAIDTLVAACVGLRYLNVDRGTEITLSTVQLLTKCVYLEVLHTGSLNLMCEDDEEVNLLSLDAVKQLGASCSRLRSLHISNCRQLSDEQLSALLIACTALTEVALIEFCEPYADATYSALCNCRHITHLDLTGNAYLLDHHMSNIVYSVGPQLSTLILKDCDGLAYVGFPSTSSTFCENLTVLDLSGIRHVNDSLVAKIATRCRKLNTLLLHHVYTLSYERGFNPILLHLNSLHTLSIMVLMQPVYWVGLGRICERYGAQLTSLTVGYQKPGISLRSADIASIAKHCKNLTNLELMNFSLRGVSHSALKTMFKKCDKLRRLNFSQTDINNKAITRIAKHCHALSVLNLSGCLSVSGETLLSLSKCDALTYLVVTGRDTDPRIKYGLETINDLKESRVNLTIEVL